MIKKVFYNIYVFLAAFLILSVAADIYYYNRVIEKDAYPKGQICYSDFRVFWQAAHNMRYHIVYVSDNLKGEFTFKPLWFLSPVYRANVMVTARDDIGHLEFRVYNKEEPFYHFRYSPFIAYAMIPLGRIKTPGDALIVWYILLNAVLCLALFVLVKLLCADFGLSAEQGLAILWFTSAAALRFYLVNISLGQTDILVLSILVIFLAAYVRRYFAVCGVMLALVLQLKPFFLPVLIYFLVSGRAKIVLSTLLCLAAFLVIPSHYVGMAKALSLIKDWVEIVSISVPSQVLNAKNQSFVFFIGNIIARFRGAGGGVKLAYFLGGTLTLCVYTLLYLTKRNLRGRDETGFAYLEISILIVTSVVFSPLVWEAHFIALSIPFAAVFAFMKNSADRILIYAALSLFFILSCVAGTDLTKFIPHMNNAKFINIALGALFLSAGLIYSYKRRPGSAD